MELDSFLINRIFPNFPEKKVREIAEAIRQSIIKGLTENTWLSPSGKKEAINKITIAKLFLVKPQNAKEWNFRPVATYSQDDRIENNRILGQVEFQKQLSDLKSSVNRVAWKTDH